MTKRDVYDLITPKQTATAPIDVPRYAIKQSEKEILRDVRIALGQIDGCCFWRNNVGAGKSMLDGGQFHAYGLGTGSADVIGCVDGRFCALEVKTETGCLSPEQIRWHDLVRKNGGFVCVVRSSDDAVAAITRCRSGLQA